MEVGTAEDPGRVCGWGDANVDRVCMEFGPGTSAQSERQNQGEAYLIPT